MLDINQTNIKPLAALIIIGYALLTATNHLIQILTSLFQILFLYLAPQWDYFEFYPVIPRFIIVSIYALLVFKYSANFEGQILIWDLPRKFSAYLISITVTLMIVSYGLSYLVGELSFKLRNSYHQDFDAVAVKGLILSVLNLAELIIVLYGLNRLVKLKPEIE